MTRSVTADEHVVYDGRDTSSTDHEGNDSPQYGFCPVDVGHGLVQVVIGPEKGHHGVAHRFTHDVALEFCDRVAMLVNSSPVLLVLVQTRRSEEGMKLYLDNAQYCAVCLEASVIKASEQISTTTVRSKHE